MGDTKKLPRTRRVIEALAAARRWLPNRKTRMPLLVHVLIMLALAVVVTLGARQLVGIGYTANKPGLELLKVALLITGGIGGVVALVVAYRRQRLSETADEREHDRLFNERFATASSLLGSAHAASRLSGTYAMAQLADNWNAGRQTCINVLCAYMRMPYTPPKPSSEEPDTEEQQLQRRAAEQEQQVRHAVMDSIGERLRQDPVDGKTWHGHNFNLSAAVIDGGNWQNVKVTGGQVTFDEAKFTGGKVTFNWAEVTRSEVSFNTAKFTSSEVSFNRADFIGGQIDLRWPTNNATPLAIDGFPNDPPNELMFPPNPEPERAS